MAVSLNVCFFFYGLLILGALMSGLARALAEKAEVKHQSGDQTVSDEAMVEGMMWLALGQTP